MRARLAILSTLAVTPLSAAHALSPPVPPTTWEVWEAPVEGGTLGSPEATRWWAAMKLHREYYANPTSGVQVLFKGSTLSGLNETFITTPPDVNVNRWVRDDPAVQQDVLAVIRIEQFSVQH